MTATLLETVELDNSSSTIVVNSISQDYDDLLIYVSGRNATSGSNRGFIYPNGVSADLAETGLQGSGTIIGSISHQFVINYSDDIANAFSNCHTYIENYSSTSEAKAMHSMFANEDNATQAYVGMASSLWDNTSAITSLEFHLNDGTFAAGSKVTIYGISKVAASPKATGGIINYDANAGYFYHTFTASGTFTPSETLSADVLVVAGGGGGGGFGGGGAGGYLEDTARSLTTSAYTVTIGAGGSRGAEASGATGGQGSGSGFDGISAIGGGGGGANVEGTNGGSGGGGGVGSGGTALQGDSGGAVGYGNNGGSGEPDRAGGGGGGASQAGQNGDYPNSAGNGGNGRQWVDGNYYAGGGGGVSNFGDFGAPGLGGGGDRNLYPAHGGLSGTGGGGAGGRPYAGGLGGSGVVIIRYAA